MSYLVDGDGWAAIKYRRPVPDNPYCLRVQLLRPVGSVTQTAVVRMVLHLITMLK